MKLTIIILLIITTIAVGFLLFKLFTTKWLITTKKISGPTNLSPDWVELRPDTKLSAKKNIQTVVLRFAESSEWDFQNSVFIAPDGKEFKIEVQVVDSEGAVYNMDSLSIGKGLGFGRKGGNNLNGSYSTLPKDKLYTTVKIRSSSPLAVELVEWYDTTNY